MAKCIDKGEKKLTVLSNSLLICFEAGRSRANTVIGVGGEADHTKFSECSLCEVLDMSQVDVQVTDAAVDRAGRVLEKSGVQVLVTSAQLCGAEV